MENKTKYTEHKNGGSIRLDYKKSQLDGLLFFKDYTTKLKIINNKLNLAFGTLTTKTIGDILDNYSIVSQINKMVNAYYDEVNMLENKTSTQYEHLITKLANKKSVDPGNLSISIDDKDLDIIISDMSGKLKLKVDTLEDVTIGLSRFLSNGEERKILSVFDDIKILNIK